MTTPLRTLSAALALAFTLTSTRVALAETDDSVRVSLPSQLQPVASGNVIRVDGTAAAFDDANGNLDIAASSVVSARYQVTKRWAPMLRLGLVGNNAPGAAVDGSSFANPLVGAAYTRVLGDYRMAVSIATTIPVGMGGGNDPDPRAAKANAASITARPADSALFEVNYMTPAVTADVAYVKDGFTAQGEAALQQGIRVRGATSGDSDDRFRTRAAVGLHLGYFIGSRFSIGSDVRYERWLSEPTDSMSGPHAPFFDVDKDTLTVSMGMRLHFRIGDQTSVRPGIFFTRGIGGQAGELPVITDRTNAIQIDVPVLF